MKLTPPECSTYPSTSCTEQDWGQCAACAHVVCLVHNELITVLYSGFEANGEDEVCSSCTEALYENGELVMGDRYQYINRR
jgi:hypothetical protein